MLSAFEKIINFFNITVLYIITVFLLFFLYLYYPDFFMEDHLIENIQVFLLLSTSVVAFINPHRFQWHRYRVFCYFSGIGFLFVLMEEISFGQRIFGFKSPDLFLKLNQQQEINFHNFFDYLDGNIYFLIMLWATASLLKQYKVITKSFFVAIPFCSKEIGFLILFLYFATVFGTAMFSTFSEGFELLWYLLILIFFIGPVNK